MPPDQPVNHNNHRNKKYNDADTVHPVHHSHIAGFRRIRVLLPDVEITQYLLPDTFHTVKIVKLLFSFPLRLLFLKLLKSSSGYEYQADGSLFAGDLFFILFY